MPKTFYAVLFIEFWERFAFYGLQSIGVIYFVKKFNLLESNAVILLSSFSALLYALLVVGGIIGDKLLGLSRTYFLGIVFLIAGYAMLSIVPSISGLYSGMGLVLVGNVLFKTNATHYVSRCFESNDPRLDFAYTYFYMSINLGALFGILLTPIVSQIFGYPIGLSLLAVAMLIALLSYFIFIARFRSADNQAGKNTQNMWLKMLGVTLLGIIFAAAFSGLFKNLLLCRIALCFAAVVVLVIYLYVASRLNRYEGRGMYVALFFMFQAIIFFALYIQSSTSMTLFALHNIRLSFLGYSIPAGVTQSLSPLSVILLSPILANFYLYRCKKSGQDFSLCGKFATGLVISGVGFITLACAAQFFPDQNSQISIVWLILAYVLYATGELLVAAIGPSMVAQLLPKRLGGFAQGAWFLCWAIGMQLGGQLSTLATVDAASSAQSLVSYMELFYRLGLVTVVIGIGFILVVKPIQRAVEQVKLHRG